MSIKFDKEYNKKIHDTVRYANARIARLEKHGVKLFNRTIKVRDLKKRYPNKKDLDRELNLLKNLTVKEGLKPNKLSNWQTRYYGKDVEAARDYFKTRYDRLNNKLGNMPADRTHVNTFLNKYKLLSKNASELSSAELKDYNATMREYYAYPSHQRSGYRGFLSEVDLVMERLEYSDEDRNELFRKLSKLDPDQFQAMYDEVDLIGKIYDLGGSPTGKGSFKIDTSDDDAKEQIELLLVKVDGLVKKYKEY